MSTRRILSSIAALLAAATMSLGIAAPSQASTSKATRPAAVPAGMDAAFAPCAYVRLYRATGASRGGVDTAPGAWIGSDYYTGGVVYPSRFGGYDHLAAHGNNLVPFSLTYYRFINRVTGEVRVNTPGVSHNSVMRDDNRDYPNNRVFAGRLLSPGFWELAVSFQDRCDYQTYTAFLGFVQL